MVSVVRLIPLNPQFWREHLTKKEKHLLLALWHRLMSIPLRSAVTRRCSFKSAMVSIPSPPTEFRFMLPAGIHHKFANVFVEFHLLFYKLWEWYRWECVRYDENTHSCERFILFFLKNCRKLKSICAASGLESVSKWTYKVDEEGFDV